MNKLKKTITQFILVSTCICIGMLNTYIAQALEISKNNYEQVNANLSNRSNKLAPEIEYITPVSGPETGGNFFAIRGKNFVEGTTVTIGGKPLQNIKIPQSF
ncbi:MAG TPA: hypothetical protein DCM59_08440, partial [Clostridium sp.]|nr:hypothetical protein [Clostridium sp.]